MKTRLLIASGTALLMGCSMQPLQRPVTAAESPSPTVMGTSMPAPGPSSLDLPPNSSPTRVEKVNPSLDKEVVLAKMLDRIRLAENTIYPSPNPGISDMTPIVQGAAVIRASRIEERTFRWVSEHHPIHSMAWLSPDSPVWMVVIEGEIPMTALPHSSNQAGIANRVEMLLSVENEMILSLTTQ